MSSILDVLPDWMKHGVLMSARLNQMLREAAWPAVVESMTLEQRKVMSEICEQGKWNTMKYMAMRSTAREWCQALVMAAWCRQLQKPQVQG